MNLRPQGYEDDRGMIFYQQLLERLPALPGVRSVSMVDSLPLRLGYQRRGLAIERYTRRPNEDPAFDYATVGPSYLETLRVPLVQGRAFSDQDRKGASEVIIVNQTFARRFWPGQEPLGQRVRMPGPQIKTLEVIGVARDGKYRTLGEEPRPFFYLPFLQNYRSSMDLVLRTTQDPKSVLTAVRSEVRRLDRNLPVTDIRTLEEHMGVSLFPARLAASVLGLFGLLALGLAAVGLYGVIGYAVAQRTREIGIRMALGARRGDVLQMVLKEAMTLTAIGVAIGLAGASGTTRFFSSFLYGIQPTDAFTFVAVTTALVVVAFGAGYLPARKATRVDPMTALRYE